MFKSQVLHAPGLDLAKRKRLFAVQRPELQREVQGLGLAVFDLGFKSYFRVSLGFRTSGPQTAQPQQGQGIWQNA